jgi:drug/metabolite transporter (DMT)-like permease
MRIQISPHRIAVLQAILVTFLWATSWVFIRFGLADIPALTFAGLRYTVAFVCLLPLLARAGQRAAVRGLSRRQWGELAALGIIYYAVTQGTQFAALKDLPAVTLSLLLNFSAVIIALLGIVLLAEYPTRRQWGGVAVFLVGVVVYFYPVMIPTEEARGLVIGMVSVLANAVSSILGRWINRAVGIPPLTVTLVSMGIGAVVLLSVGLAVEGLPSLTLVNWLVIGWLALVNTAFAFTLWNHTLRTLSAVESSLINNTMLVQITVLAWLFLGETITVQEGIGLLLALAGILVVSTARRVPAR